MMTSKSETETEVEAVPSGFFGAGKSRSAAELAKSVPAIRPSRPSNSQSRRSAMKTKKGRASPFDPTPERLAKGDVDVRTGMHRSISTIERLRDQGKLAPKQLANSDWTYDTSENQARYEAALKLRRHFEEAFKGVQAQDLNRVIGKSTVDDLTKEEAWVFHRNKFIEAINLMGWSDLDPYKGAGRIVVSVVCYEQTVFDAALAHTSFKQKDAVGAVGMDRLRDGLAKLAERWRIV